MPYDNSRVTTIIAKIGAFLRDPLPTVDKDLKVHLTGLECLRLELLEARVDWQMLLNEKKSQYLHPKDKDLTELDRRIDLNARLANIERDTEFLVGLEKLVEDRLELGKVFL